MLSVKFMTGLSLISPFQFFPNREDGDAEFIFDLDIDSESDYESDNAGEASSGNDKISLDGDESPHLPDLVTSTQKHETPRQLLQKASAKPKADTEATDKNYAPKVSDSKFLDSVSSLSGRSQRKRVRPKRFQEAFDELEVLAKIYKNENEESESQPDESQNEESDQEKEELEIEDPKISSKPQVVLDKLIVNGSQADSKPPPPKGLKNGYYCERCQKSFKAKSDLERHKATIYCICRCVECQVSFHNEEYLKKHMETEHRPLSELKKTLKEDEKKTPAKSAPKPPTKQSVQKAPAKQTAEKPITIKPRPVDMAKAPRKCCVLSCVKIRGNAKYLCTFPKEPELAVKWEERIEKSNKKPLTPLDVYVCSKHFREELYMGSGLLKPGSLPSIFSDPKKKLKTDGD